MPRRYVLLLAQSALIIALSVAAATGVRVPDWLAVIVIVVWAAMIFGYFTAVRDVIANPRLELEPKIVWVVAIVLAFPIAVPLYVFRHGLSWRRATESEPGRAARAPIWPPSSSG